MQKINELGSEAFFIYNSEEYENSCICLRIQMVDSVNGEMLKKAVIMAMRRYPYLKVRIRLIDERIVLEANNEPVMVINTQNPVSLGNEESNHHLIAFSWWGDTFCLNFHHALLDGASSTRVIAAVLYYYCMERYDKTLSSDGITDSQISPEELEDPFNFELPDNTRPFVKPNFNDRILNLTDYVRRDEEGRVYDLLFSGPEIMALCKNTNSSPLAFFAVVMTNALRKVHPDIELPVNAGIAVNFRNFIGKEKLMKTSVFPITVTLDKKVKKFDTQLIAVRGQIILRSDPDNYLPMAYQAGKIFQRINALPSLREKRDGFKKLFTGKTKNTFELSYTGRMPFGATSKYVKTVYLDGAMAGSDIMLEMFAVEDRFCVSFIQEWKDPVYFDAFRQVLDEMGINMQVQSEHPITKIPYRPKYGVRPN